MNARLVLLASIVGLAGNVTVCGQDWPQWRGPNRDASTGNFTVPATWPKALARKWDTAVGEGVSTPALVGDRLYVFSRQEGAEVLRCLSAADGHEIWQEKYESLGAEGPSSGFSGPRSSPAVAGGRIVTIGVRGMISCVDADKGTVLWRKDQFHGYPQFYQASSPVIVGDMAIAQLGGGENGAVVAYDLGSGGEKWKWSGPSPSYASPALLALDDRRLVLARTTENLVALNVADGTLVWDSGKIAAGGRDYHASSPVVEGRTVILSGSTGVQAFALEKEGDKLAGHEQWHNTEVPIQFNTPTVKGGKVFGLTATDELFCLDATSGKTVWRAKWPADSADNTDRRAAMDSLMSSSARPFAFAQADPNGQRRRGPGRPGGGMRRGGRMGGGGFGSLVDAGPVLMALTPGGKLIFFDPAASEFKPLASYPVAEGQTYAYPVASGNRIFIKDANSVTLWLLE